VKVRVLSTDLPCSNSEPSFVRVEVQLGLIDRISALFFPLMLEIVVEADDTDAEKLRKVPGNETPAMKWARSSPRNLSH